MEVTRTSKVTIELTDEEAQQLYNYLENKEEEMDDEYYGSGAGEFFGDLFGCLECALP